MGRWAAVVLAAAAILVFHREVWLRPPTLAVLFFAAVALMIVAIMLLAAKGRSFRQRPLAQGRVVAIVPVYNEDPALLRACLDSLLAGSEIPELVVVVDDGSQPPAAVYGHPRVRWLRQANQGKRIAQVNGLRGCEWASFVLTVDSDSVVHREAISNGLRALSDPRVMAVTATCVVRNRSANLLTRLTDLEVVNGNFIMRRARSVLGVVAPTSGPFAMYRSVIFFANVEDYVRSGTYSDDRRLTHYALLRGQVVANDDCIVEMQMPTTLRAMFRQRTRWFQGYFRYLPWELTNLSGWALFLRLWNVVLVVAFPLVFVWALLVAPLLHGSFYWEAWLYWAGLLYAMTLHYATERPGLRARERWAAWLLTPLMIPLQFLVIRPAMYWALLQLRSVGWRTR